MTFSYRIFNCIEHVDVSEWQRVRYACNGSIVMDPRFIAAVEVSMKQVEKFWYIVLYDEGGVAVLYCSASAMTVDLADLADPGLVRIIRHIPLLFSRLRHLKILICGLPIGTGGHTLGLEQLSASPGVLPVLDKIICDLATEVQADAIVYKEFGEDDLQMDRAFAGPGLPAAFDAAVVHLQARVRRFRAVLPALRKRFSNANKITTRRNSDNTRNSRSSSLASRKRYCEHLHVMFMPCIIRWPTGPAIEARFLPIEFLHQLICG